MINRIIIFLLFFISFSFAQDGLDLSSKLNSNKIKEHMYCIQEDKVAFFHKDIKNMTHLKAIKKTNLGYNLNNYWCKLEIVNKSDKTIKRIFTNPRAGMDLIDVNIFKKDVTEKFLLGDLENPNNRSYHSGLSNFEFNLEANEKAIIITKYNTVGVLDVAWEILTYKEFIEEEHKKNIFIYLFLGFILSMAIYKFFIYTHIKDKEYLIYTFMLISIFLAQFALYGDMHLYFHDFVDPFLITLCNWTFVHLFLTLLWVYSIVFFNVDKSSKFFYLLWFVVIYNAIITIIYTLSYFDHTILQITPLVSIIAFFESLLLLLFSGIMLYRKKAGSGYFFIGHLLYILAVLNYVMVLNGKVESSFFNNYSPSIGLFVVILFMSLALSRKFKHIKEENIIARKAIEDNKQYTMIGTTISYISHQWKQPLSIISSITSSISAKIEHKPDTKISQIKTNIEDIENSVLNINETMNDIKNLFNNNDRKNSEFTFNDLIIEIKNSYEKYFKENSIDFRSYANEYISFYGNKNLFIHAISNLVQNSIEQFTNQKNKKIKISCQLKEETIVLKIEDNSGGIKEENIDKIFDSFYTTKTFGSGIGLAFVKNIIETKFKGRIDVENIDDGSCFTIRISNPKRETL